MLNSVKNYIKSSIEEMKKVAWPTKKETTDYTILVIALSAGVAIYLGMLDYIFTKGLEILINR
jgi:preprotein translocase subunit SecE